MVMRTNLLRALSLLDAVGASLDPTSLVANPTAATEAGKPETGKAVGGLRLTLDRAAHGVLKVTFQNVAKTPMIVNLGVMLANGRTMIPNQLYLIVTGASGHARRLAWKGFCVTGPMNDFLVPLMPAATYTLSLALNDFVEHGRNSAVVAGEKVRVVYLGAAPSHLNHASAADLPVWDGKVDTATLPYVE